MIPSVTGTTTWSFSRTRSMNSYWPLQTMVYPGGSVIWALTSRCASRT